MELAHTHQNDTLVQQRVCCDPSCAVKCTIRIPAEYSRTSEMPAAAATLLYTVLWGADGAIIPLSAAHTQHNPQRRRRR